MTAPCHIAFNSSIYIREFETTCRLKATTRHQGASQHQHAGSTLYIQVLSKSIKYQHANLRLDLTQAEK